MKSKTRIKASILILLVALLFSLVAQSKEVENLTQTIESHRACFTLAPFKYEPPTQKQVDEGLVFTTEKSCGGND